MCCHCSRGGGRRSVVPYPGKGAQVSAAPTLSPVQPHLTYARLCAMSDVLAVDEGNEEALSPILARERRLQHQRASAVAPGAVHSSMPELSRCVPALASLP